MQDKHSTRIRLLRFIAWALAMVATSLVMNNFAPQRVIFVPCFFMVMMVPAVLLPLESKRKDRA
jgi:hypothetical protein